MSTITVEESRHISAPPDAVYNFLSDYSKRPLIITENFHDFTVQQGGRGAGTVYRYRLRAGGREREYIKQVDEPQKGRELREKDTRSSLVTTWYIRPAAQGRESDVTLTTTWEGSGGMGGFFERTFAPRELKRIYNEVLDRLALQMASRTERPQPVG